MLITPRRSAPMITPGMVPLPPYADAPPMKQEPMASISKEVPVEPFTEPTRARQRSPQRPARRPMFAYLSTPAKSDSGWYLHDPHP